MKKNIALLFCGIFFSMMASAVPKNWVSQARSYSFTPSAESDSMRLTVKFNGPASGVMELYPESTNDVISIHMSPRTQYDYHVWGKKEKSDAHRFNGLRLDVRSKHKTRHIGFFNIWWGYEFVYWFRPFFDSSKGLYDHKQVTKYMPKWEKDWPLFENREMEFKFEYNKERNRTEVWLDRNFAGSMSYRGKIKKVNLKLFSFQTKKDEPAKPHPTATCETYTAKIASDMKLPARRGHVNDLMRENAKIVIDPKFKKTLGGMFDVWPAELSCDSGLHIRTQHARSFGSDPYYNRTPWQTGPEYMHWTVPGKFYHEALVLCANVPRKDTTPVLGTILGRYGVAANPENVAATFTDLSDEAVQKNKDVRKVGVLKYLENGEEKETPLYLVRQRINIGKMLHVINDKQVFGYNEITKRHSFMPRFQRDSGNYLDFELIGAKNQNKIRSSIQVFGCTLRTSPYKMDIVESERGNIFHNDEKPETGVEVVASHDNVKGSVAWEILDDNFKSLKSGEIPFSLAKKGEKKILKVDLNMDQVGWYMLKYQFKDAKGTTIVKHDAAFTLLGKNDREAGYESPYACWPQGTSYTYKKDRGGFGFWNLGKSQCNPNRAEVAEIMYKAGYHTAWGVPAKDENEFAEYKITVSSLSDFCNGIYWPANLRYNEKDLQAISNRLDKAVEAYREQIKRYPHCKTIQILHEQGGKVISKELLGEVKVEDRKPYKGLESPHLLVWATECAKRMRKEFPGYHLQLGNGSSSCEMIGFLLRNGFDLSLVDTLGIESKGFYTMSEICREFESPGMLWALKETATMYGYSNMLVNACNEYVFRPERPGDVVESRPYDLRMRMTNYAMRDCLVSLAHGCWTISIGHIEDCDEPYYNTNWGAGGQCTFYPMSYPKRMFTALANLTKVLDKPKLSKCIDVKNANAVWAVEFLRERRKQDYATAVWAASAHGRIEMEYPAGAKVRRIDWQGRGRDIVVPAGGKIVLDVGPTPYYLVCDEKAIGATYLGANKVSLPSNIKKIASVTPKTVYIQTNGHKGWCHQGCAWGYFDMKPYHDEELNMDVTEFILDREKVKPASQAIEELCTFGFNAKQTDPAGYDEIGIWVKGNGTFGRTTLMVNTSSGTRRVGAFQDRSSICFDGWRLLRAAIPSIKPDKDGKRWIRPAQFIFGTGRYALNPKDMILVPENICVGDVVLIDSKSKKDNVEKGYNAMDFVSEKDL